MNIELEIDYVFSFDHLIVKENINNFIYFRTFNLLYIINNNRII